MKKKLPWKEFSIILAILIVSLFIAEAWTTAQKFWWLVPDWLMDVAMRYFKPEGQEQVADVEFGVMYLLAVLYLIFARLVAVVLVRFY